MGDQNSWHNQDKFWELFEPFLFDGKQQKSAKAEAENVVKLLKTDFSIQTALIHIKNTKKANAIK